jgi:hypothetical protein
MRKLDKLTPFDVLICSKIILVGYVQGLKPIIGDTFTISWQIIKGVQAIKVINGNVGNSSWF